LISCQTVEPKEQKKTLEFYGPVFPDVQKAIKNKDLYLDDKNQTIIINQSFWDDLVKYNIDTDDLIDKINAISEINYKIKIIFDLN
jgi:hypothetical protein